jgi:hypothetical protein
MAAWIFAFVLGVLAWAGWREYDYRAAVREAQSLGWKWKSDEPFAKIRADWRSAFRKETWERNSMLDVMPPGDLAAHGKLIRRLNPTSLNFW